METALRLGQYVCGCLWLSKALETVQQEGACSIQEERGEDLTVANMLASVP